MLVDAAHHNSREFGGVFIRSYPVQSERTEGVGQWARTHAHASTHARTPVPKEVRATDDDSLPSQVRPIWKGRQQLSPGLDVVVHVVVHVVVKDAHVYDECSFHFPSPEPPCY